MTKKHGLLLGSTIVLTLSAFGCGSSSSSSSAVTSSTPSDIVSSISTGIQTAGKGLVTSSALMLMNQLKERPPEYISTSSCNTNGYPSGLSTSDTNYPGYLTYCFLTVNSGDTVIGGFSTPTMVSCFLKEAGVTFSAIGSNETTITITDAILSKCSASSTGLTNGTQVKVTTSSPASFNSKYSNGAVMDLSSSIGLTFKLAFNTSGSTSSFLTNESWTDGSIGTTAGTFDTSSGKVWYESRVERNNCSTSSRCGWNRHTRIHANVTMNGSTPTGLKDLSFAYSNIQFTPGQSSLGGVLVTASGTLSTGIKARLWNATNGSGGSVGSISDYNTIANWVEVSNSKCYTSSSETASGCGTGIDRFSSSTKFLLNSTDSHTSVSSWVSSITGQSFSSVDINSDTQF